MTRGTLSTLSTPSKCFWRGWSKRGHKKNENRKNLKIKDKIKKRCPGGRRLHLQRPQSVFEEDEAEEAAESSSPKCWPGNTYVVQLNWLLKVEFSSQSISEYWNRTTTSILQAINHFCNVFGHILWRDSHSLLMSPRIWTYISEALLKPCIHSLWLQPNCSTPLPPKIQLYLKKFILCIYLHIHTFLDTAWHGSLFFGASDIDATKS